MLLDKLAAIKIRFEEVGEKLTLPDVVSDQKKYAELSRQYKELEPIVNVYTEYKLTLENIESSKEVLATEEDEEMKEMAKMEIDELISRKNEMDEEIKILLIPKDPEDNKNVIIELRAGTGGDEACIFVEDMFRLYTMYFKIIGWKYEVINSTEGTVKGYKEIALEVKGDEVYGTMKFESGVHRVQRVPETESQGRIHTSTCTVAILPEVEEVQDINIDKNDLRVDTFRASGAGGQHVNKTDSAVRLTHIPTGIVVECQDGRSQHKNKEKALSLLAAKLKQQEIDSQQESIASERKILVGTGDRSEKIRTYNFPQGRMTDHRIKLTQHNLDQIMDGDIKTICDALLAENQLAMLSQLESE